MARQPDTRTVVHYQHPAGFTETKRLHGAGIFNEDDDYLAQLKRYLIKQADGVLAPGQRLEVTITDIARAGSFEPWLGPNFDHVRIIKSIYPPRIELNFTLYGTNGTVLRQGQRKLTNLAFMDTVSSTNQDPLRYEKALIKNWLRRGPDRL
ncbi:DUF3016 domain-containing protein [Oleiagrimonas sp. C23AA]|nr:DUF3016 domain-containing protein [Oleiagrimonas sp. C23AA]